MREKMHALARRLKAAGVRLVFASAPYAVPPECCGGREAARAWWMYEPDEQTEGEGGGDAADDGLARFRRAYQGWEESRRYLAGVWASEGPFDAVLGFSQGAVVAHQLLRECAGKLPPPEGCEGLFAAPPACAVLICGFPARHGPALPEPPPREADDDEALLSPLQQAGALLPLRCAEVRVRTPALVVVGERDALVPPALQHELAAAIVGAELLIVAQGHAMPQRSADCAAIVDFILLHARRAQES